MHIMLLQNTIVTLQITDFLFQAFKYIKTFMQVTFSIFSFEWMLFRRALSANFLAPAIIFRVGILEPGVLMPTFVLNNSQAALGPRVWISILEIECSMHNKC